MSQTMQTVLLSLATSLFVSMVTFILGLCKSQYKNVGLGQYKNVGFPTFLYCLFSLHLL